jgi:hypothetical protein
MRLATTAINGQKVMSSDAFGAFEDVGLDNEEKSKKVGLRVSVTRY